MVRRAKTTVVVIERPFYRGVIDTASSTLAYRRASTGRASPPTIGLKFKAEDEFVVSPLPVAPGELGVSWG